MPALGGVPETQTAIMLLDPASGDGIPHKLRTEAEFCSMSLVGAGADTGIKVRGEEHIPVFAGASQLGSPTDLQQKTVSITGCMCAESEALGWKQ